jgi:hypothetical protein
MDEITQIVRDIGRQQGQNAYYRTCYALLKRLQECIDQSSNDLLRLYQSGTLGSPNEEAEPINLVMDELRNSVHSLVGQAQNAQASCEMICPVDPCFSARDAFIFPNVDKRFL